MRLIHYSASPLIEVHSVSQGVGKGATRGTKPNGLWVSVEGDDDWPSWCRSENFALNSLANETEVVLRPDAQVLIVSGGDDLRAFHDAYATTHPMFDEGWSSYAKRKVIDWKRVADEHSGVIIAPYVWEWRLDLNLNWYSGWDCASGCIWDHTAISELRPLDTALTPPG